MSVVTSCIIEKYEFVLIICNNLLMVFCESAEKYLCADYLQNLEYMLNLHICTTLEVKFITEFFTTTLFDMQ